MKRFLFQHCQVTPLQAVSVVLDQNNWPSTTRLVAHATLLMWERAAKLILLQSQSLPVYTFQFQFSNVPFPCQFDNLERKRQLNGVKCIICNNAAVQVTESEGFLYFVKDLRNHRIYLRWQNNNTKIILLKQWSIVRCINEGALQSIFSFGGICQQMKPCVTKCL